MTTELTQKLENIISGHSINEDDADWLRALTQRPAAPTLKGFTPPTAEGLDEMLAISGDFDASAGAPCSRPPGCNGSNCLGCGERPAAQTDEQTIVEICERIGFGRVQQIAGHAWDQKHHCAPRGRMGVTVRNEKPAPQQATPDQFADASKMVPPVALRSVHLTRDTAGMCVVRVNGRVAIRDNGDIIDHTATLEWFADTQQATPEPVGGSTEGEFFAFDPEGGNAFYKTQQEAINHANESLKYYQDGAKDHGEWDEDVEHVRWGVVMQRAKATNISVTEDGENSCDYELQHVVTRPAPAVPEVDDLAQFIRQIDGKHSMGAGALAEHICDWLAAAQAKGG